MKRYKKLGSGTFAAIMPSQYKALISKHLEIKGSFCADFVMC